MSKLKFSDGTIIDCVLLISEEYDPTIKFQYFNTTSTTSTVPSINIEITTNTLNLPYIHSMIGIKDNVIYIQDDREIVIDGFIITSIEQMSLNIHSQTKIDATCDFYSIMLQTEEELLRILREKKLERILKKTKNSV